MPDRPLMDDPKRAWARFEPSDLQPWDIPAVAHLHRRAGFSAPWMILARDAAEGTLPAIDRLISGEPKAMDGQDSEKSEATADLMASRLGNSASPQRLRGIWLYRMIHTGWPLRERMTLFWHDHFATSIAKVNTPDLMQRQNNLFRSQALGNFGKLLLDIGRDPAMLVWLDATASRKARPNENYAREVMELFSLGRGQYTEHDIREAARAFTGRFVSGDRFSELAGQHDTGEKTILGRTGNYSGDDVPTILLAQPGCARFLARKLFRQFVSEVDEPSDDLIEPLAACFRDSGYEVLAPVRMILESNLFHDPTTRRRRVKSPVEFAVGSVRALGAIKPTVSAEALGEACTRMGQALYAPPSVAGWEKGRSWINSASLIARTNFALALLNKADNAFGHRFDPAKLAEAMGAKSTPEAARRLADLLVQDGLDPSGRDRLLDPCKTVDEAASVLLTAPEYQLA